MRIEEQYATRWAERVVAQLGLAQLEALGREGRELLVGAQLIALGAEQHEVQAILARINALIADQERPADSPPARGRARMFL